MPPPRSEYACNRDPNQNLSHRQRQDHLRRAFAMADQVLYSALPAFTDLMVKEA